MTMQSRHVGFTGSRQGMTPAQLSNLHSLLQGAGFLWLHHGDCLGADREAHDVAVRLGIQTHRHPPTSTAFRAYCAADVSSAPADYLARNRAIVDATEELIAAPSTFSDTLRSGTWATIRYARKCRRLVMIIHPDGAMSFEP